MMTRERLSTIALGAALIAQVACAGADAAYRQQDPNPELVHDAMSELTDVIVYDIFSPPQAARTYAYASIAAYEALRHDYPEYRTLAGQVNGLAKVPAPDSLDDLYLPLASVHALMTVGKALTFSQERMDSLRAAMHERLRDAGVRGGVADRSIAYGERVAEHILTWASQDNYAQTRGYAKFTVTDEPGRWIPTPPAYMDAVEPHWARLRPFTLDSANQFRPPPPAAFDMTEASRFYREAREVYEVGRDLTDEQRAIAAFWDCNPYVMHVRGHAMFATKKITPGGHWMGIVRLAARRADADIMRSTEAYARTAIALADGFISNWDEKYRSNLIRPVTVINAHFDEAWEPLLQTPPFPEYTSGHSVISSAAAEVLTDQFGDGFAFADSVEVKYGLPPRSYPSFRAAAAEAAISRLYGGIHYRQAIVEGVAQGQRVGRHVVARVQTRRPAVVAAARPDGARVDSSASRSAH